MENKVTLNDLEAFVSQMEAFTKNLECKEREFKKEMKNNLDAVQEGIMAALSSRLSQSLQQGNAERNGHATVPVTEKL
jgi:hypothetical protein